MIWTPAYFTKEQTVLEKDFYLQFKLVNLGKKSAGHKLSRVHEIVGGAFMCYLSKNRSSLFIDSGKWAICTMVSTWRSIFVVLLILNVGSRRTTLWMMKVSGGSKLWGKSLVPQTTEYDIRCQASVYTPLSVLVPSWLRCGKWVQLCHTKYQLL